MWKRCWRPSRTAVLQARQRTQAQAQTQVPSTTDQRAYIHCTSVTSMHSASLGINVRAAPVGPGLGRQAVREGRRQTPFAAHARRTPSLWLCPTHQAIVRNASIWSKIKPDPLNPFFARRSTRNTPNTVVVLLRNASIPMMQSNPPVFMPETADQVQHALNTLLFMSDFNIEPKPLAVNVFACSSTGLIHYLQIANEHLSLILPVYFITDGGQHPNKLPPLLRTFLESTTYTKVGFGAFEDAQRLKEQYDMDCKALLDIQWMTRVMGIGATHVGGLDPVFGNAHTPFIPGRVKDALPRASFDTIAVASTTTNSRTNRSMRTKRRPSPVQRDDDECHQVVDARRWDWEAHGDMDWTPELIRCVAQDAFVTLSMLDAIQKQRYRTGYPPPVSDFQELVQKAHAFLLSSIPRGTLVPMKSFHHLLKGGRFLSDNLDTVERDAQALAIVCKLVEQELLTTDMTDQQSRLEFSHPSVLNRRVQLPGLQPSAELMSNNRSRRLVADLFGCRPDELRLIQDSNWTRKPDKIQDLECFLGLYDWLEHLPGALEPLLDVADEQAHGDRRRETETLGAQSSSMLECGRKPAALLGLCLNFGTLAEQARQEPVETRQWAQQRMNRLIDQGMLVASETSGLVRIHPTILQRLKGIRGVDSETQTENSSKNKDMRIAL